MKILAILAVVLAGAGLLRTNHSTPFLRWGIVIAIAGVALLTTAGMFAVRGVLFGAILCAAGAAVYYYGRFVRREQLLVPKPK